MYSSFRRLCSFILWSQGFRPLTSSFETFPIDFGLKVQSLISSSSFFRYALMALSNLPCFSFFSTVSVLSYKYVCMLVLLGFSSVHWVAVLVGLLKRRCFAERMSSSRIFCITLVWGVSGTTWREAMENWLSRSYMFYIYLNHKNKAFGLHFLVYKVFILHQIECFK